MALNTENRRRIVVGVLPVADSVIDAEDRGGVLGILYFEPVVQPIVPVWTDTDLADYHPLGKWRIESWEVGTSLNLTLRDLKTRMENVIASDVFDRDTYPNAPETTLGRTIPLIYGKVRRVPAFMVDDQAKTFKVSNHAVTTMSVFADGVSVTVDSINLSTGEFTWADHEAEDMTVDTAGAIVNPADVIYDLLTVWGSESASDTYQPGSGDDREGEGFGTYGSRTYWLQGTDRDGVEHNTPDLSIYIDREADILEIIEDVEKFSFCSLYTGTDGLLTLRPWEPIRSQDVTYFFRDYEVFEAERSDQTSDTITRVAVSYRKDYANDSSQIYVGENEEGRLLRGLPAHITEEVDAPFYTKFDAEQWASRYTFMRSKPEETWNLEVTPKAWFLRPGDAVDLTYSNRGMDGVFEVLSIEFTVGKGPVKLLVGNWRGFSDTVGWRSIDSPTFPADLGGASAETWSAGWSAAQKAWARANIMYFTDDNELAEATDADAFRAGSFT